MQWSHAPNAGFSTAEANQLYLPIEKDLDKRTAADQDQDPNSLLNSVRTLAKLRLAHPALASGTEYQVVYAMPMRYPFAYLRHGGGERVVVALNPADRLVDVDLPADALPAGSGSPSLLWGIEGGFTRTAQGWRIRLPGVSGGIYQV
jgi:maltose alpha-D-glucosyltransferase/alpha-amylase